MISLDLQAGEVSGFRSQEADSYGGFDKPSMSNLSPTMSTAWSPPTVKK